ncbi:MAG: hypothetical protein II992_12090 [Lachnospiraceae bacterium]|nr:hypothetical protein [Lachnospiraceae bacterium]
MKRMIRLIFCLGLVLLAGGFLEIKYEMFSSYMKWDMSEEEKNAYVEKLREGMLNGEEIIELTYIGSGEDIEEFVVESITNAFKIDKKNTSSDGDYMRYIHKASHVSMTGYGRKYKVIYEMQYLETKEQTEETHKMVKKVLEEMNIEKLSDYEIIKKVHDYVINHTNYDMSTSLNSPYYAMVKGSSACQGYAVLIYKMLTEAGVPCRVVTGTAQGGLHAWNIVKVEGKWYNLDATWDDPVGLFGDSNMRYQFFLKSDMDNKEHVKDKEFVSESFLNKYPMAMSSYVG